MPVPDTGAQPEPDMVDIDLDGEHITALRGQTLLAAMIAGGHWVTRHHLVTGEPRGGYCGMGVCFECECEVNGEPQVRACMTVVEEPLTVRTRSDQVLADPGGPV